MMEAEWLHKRMDLVGNRPSEDELYNFTERVGIMTDGDEHTQNQLEMAYQELIK